MPQSSGKIRVVQVIGSMHIGGAENAVVHLAEGLDRAQFDVSVCCTTGLGELADRLRERGVRVDLAKPQSHALRHLIPLVLWRTLRRLGADVVHSHGTPGLVHAGPVAWMRMLPPWVHTFHFGNYPLANPREMWAERYFSRYVDALVAVSESQRQSIIRHHGVAPDDIITITNGVAEHRLVSDPSIRAARRAEFGFRDDEIVVGCIAVLSVQKGITYLLQAARELLGRHERLRFLIVGGGPLEAALREEARTLQLGDRVVFTGWRGDNVQLLMALDVFVMSSLWEAMPLALLEAMGGRRTIVVTDVGDNRLVVEDGRCGVVVPPSDVPALVAGIEWVLQNPAEADAMAGRALERFRQHYTTQHMLRRYEDVYRRVASGA